MNAFQRAGRHNRLGGGLELARRNVLTALHAPSITPEAEPHLVAALTALDAAIEELHNRRLNADGTIWERPE